MAIEQSVNEVITISSIKERTWRVQCFCEYGTDYVFEALRERVYLAPDGSIVKVDRNVPKVVRSVSQVASNPDALTMLGTVKNMADLWAEEDKQAQEAV